MVENQKSACCLELAELQSVPGGSVVVVSSSLSRKKLGLSSIREKNLGRLSFEIK